MSAAPTPPDPITDADDAGSATEHAQHCIADHYAASKALAECYARLAVLEQAAGIEAVAGRWLYGRGVPSNSIGNDGDLYLDADTADVYAKENGSWV